VTLYALEPLIARHYSRGIIVDTNLLLLYGVGLADSAGILRLKRTQQYSVEDFERLRAFLTPFHRIITTPHILTELSNLAIDKRDANPIPYLPVLIEIIRGAKELHIEKEAVLDLEYLPRLGIADCVTLELARIHDYLVVTDDFPLLGYVRSLEREALSMNDIRACS
jgi:hypothetical protein